MLEFLGPLAAGPAVPPFEVFIRLVVAVTLGGVVAWVYRRTRGSREVSATFPPTLVLLAVLIAMVTQVIGDNVARAFSLVGALSIVRFRTVVRDTQDTAFVIFAVVVGMAVGAGQLAVAGIGIAVVGVAAFLMRGRRPAPDSTSSPDVIYRLEIRVATAQQLDGPIAEALGRVLTSRQLVSIGTAKQGTSLNVSYDVHLNPDSSPETLVKTLNRIDGVQDVVLVSRDSGEF